ncbi:hypothetical protein BE04_26195 [Sorangium cellulosum]|uniref:Uncharacterized protein n=1 Tax=Sorangium cellulosum TaxID=56 RepID=A0A150P231_SORCE|nr:hypothetical protein BE04_26195 [Sorangium cellulosum]
MRHAAAAEGATDRRLNARCVPSCKPFASDAYDGTDLENGLGIGALLVGGAAVITGTVLLFVNGPESYRTRDRGGVTIELRPAASLDAAALSARLVF